MFRCIVVASLGRLLAEASSGCEAGGVCQDAKNSTDGEDASLMQLKWKESYMKCPGLYEGTPRSPYVNAPCPKTYAKALQKLDLAAVKKDILHLLTDSQPCWPADFGNYGPFFVRLAWHCSGTFRNTDGAGGCAGGRQRFEPEASWMDNDNLDKARALLAPIKQKYGDGLSWGDLFVLAGTTALRSMGAPITTVCVGRIDDPDGKKSLPLGPGAVQKAVAPCTGPDGDCQQFPKKTALAPTTLELIYVNPQGPMGKPLPAESAKQIRVVFGKMGHNDVSTVALVGGGHAFGKCHGACNKKQASGLPPNVAYAAHPPKIPWAGVCDNHPGSPTGKGNNTFTSGFEGTWTNTPTKWSNVYFQGLLNNIWETWKGPGGGIQWRIKNDPTDPRMRLTTDIALINDPSYKAIVEGFARNMTALNVAFDEAWTGLTTKGGRWSSAKRCDGGVPGVDFMPGVDFFKYTTMLSSDEEEQLGFGG